MDAYLTLLSVYCRIPPNPLVITANTRIDLRCTGHPQDKCTLDLGVRAEVHTSHMPTHQDRI